MKIILPKPSRGYIFNRLFTVEMNDFDVERLLPSLFFLVVTRGRQRASRTNDPRTFDKYLNALAKHSHIKGFDDPVGRRLLERWVRTSIVRMGKVGRAKRDEQVEFIVPLTLLAYKSGFPSEIRRQRNVHLFLYQVMLDFLAWCEKKPSSQAALADVFVRSFGSGVSLGPAPKYDGRYDGKTDLDIHTLLCLCFLDGLAATEASKREALVSFGPALPRMARQLARDLIAYMLAYCDRLPTTALTRDLMALINFSLFVYTVKLFYAVNALLKDGRLPAAMCDEETISAPDLFVDFVRQRGSTSDEIARACVERDLEELRAFYGSVMLLRTMDRFVDLQPQIKNSLKDLGTPAYLEALVGLRGRPEIEARAQAEIESIRHETLNASENSVEQEEARSFFEVSSRGAGESLTFAAELLTQAQQKKAIESYVSWFWSVGGLRKSFGLLVGNLRGRRDWRYAMTDDLLAALVRLAMVEDHSGRLEHVTITPRLPLREFLDFLERRFTVLIDRPPRMLDSALYREGANQNIAAMKRRLHQMGFFEALSDDFTAQYLNQPLNSAVGL